MNETEKNLLAAFASIDWTPPKEEYRAYYNDDGWVEFLTGSGFPETGNYIVITKEQYTDNPSWNNLKVIHKQLVRVDTRPGYRIQLKKSSSGFRVVRGHASIALNPEEIYDQVEYYAKRNH